MKIEPPVTSSLCSGLIVNPELDPELVLTGICAKHGVIGQKFVGVYVNAEMTFVCTALQTH